MMDNDFRIDLGEVLKLVDNAEVLVVRFPLTADRLLLDARAGDGRPASLGLAPRVTSLEERYRLLREARPGVAVPDRIMFIPWPKRVASFVESGVWRAMVDRALRQGSEQSDRDFLDLQRSLERSETAEIRAAISGEGHRTLWERR